MKKPKTPAASYSGRILLKRLLAVFFIISSGICHASLLSTSSGSADSTGTAGQAVEGHDEQHTDNSQESRNGGDINHRLKYRNVDFAERERIIDTSLQNLPVGSELTESDYRYLPAYFRKKWEALLHYEQGSSIILNRWFFLSPEGGYNPEKELEATLEFFRRSPDDSCYFPARYYLIYHKLPETGRCADLREYLYNISIDDVSVVLASEDKSSVVSSMGHLSIAFSGHNREGSTVKHGITFLGYVQEMNDFASEISGYYILEPFDRLRKRYNEEEHRSLREYHLNLTETEKFWLYLHIIELKDQNLTYSFTSNNCANGTRSLMTVMNQDFYNNSDHSYVTPFDYVKFIKKSPKYSGETDYLTAVDSFYNERNLLKSPDEMPPISTVTGGYTFSSLLGNGGYFSLSPFSRKITGDIRDYYFLHNFEVLNLKARVYRDSFIIDNITYIDSYSLPDILSPDFLSPGMSLSLHGKVNTEHTSLYPDVAGIMGTSILSPDTGLSLFYKLKTGLYIPHDGLNTYLINSAGSYFINRRIGRISLAYDYVWSNRSEYRGYDYAFTGGYSKELSDNLVLEAEFDYYHLKRRKDYTIDRRTASGKAGSRAMYEISAGINWRF